MREEIFLKQKKKLLKGFKKVLSKRKFDFYINADQKPLSLKLENYCRKYITYKFKANFGFKDSRKSNRFYLVFKNGQYSQHSNFIFYLEVKK